MKNLKWYWLDTEKTTLTIDRYGDGKNIRKGCTIKNNLIFDGYPRDQRMTRATSKASAREYFRQVCDAYCNTGFVISGKFVINERTEYSEIMR